MEEGFGTAVVLDDLVVLAIVSEQATMSLLHVRVALMGDDACK